ncbi:hypothetical protein GCM10027570_33340 [Streptomonospora sediminis]
MPAIALLAVVLPMALGVPWWLERQAMLDQGALPPTPTVVSAADGTAELVGSRWELRGTVVDQLEGSPEPPEGTHLVDAVFKLTPGAGESRERLADCKFRAVDDQGRWWQPASSYSARPSLEGTASVAFGCTGDDSEPLPAGEEVGVVVSFVVPDDAVDSLSFEIAVPTGDHAEGLAYSALEFEQQ